MAHEITDSDSVGLYKVPAWHGLGKIIDYDLSGSEAIKEFINWEVVKKPAYIRHEDQEIPIGVYANVRSDNGFVLGSCTRRYNIIQNAEVGEFADDILSVAKKSGANYRMETCGSLRGGKNIFLVMSIDKELRVGKSGSDIVRPYLVLLNSHKPGSCMHLFWSNVRVVCQNTFNAALSGAKSKFSVRHLRNREYYVIKAMQALEMAPIAFNVMEDLMKTMASTHLSGQEIDAYFRSLYSGIYGDFAENPKNEAEEIQKIKAVSRIESWKANMDKKTNTIDGISGTAWAAFNAFTEWADHNTRMKKNNGKLVFGSVAKAKEFAFDQALQLAI